MKTVNSLFPLSFIALMYNWIMTYLYCVIGGSTCIGSIKFYAWTSQFA